MMNLRNYRNSEKCQLEYFKQDNPPDPGSPIIQSHQATEKAIAF